MLQLHVESLSVPSNCQEIIQGTKNKGWQLTEETDSNQTNSSTTVFLHKRPMCLVVSRWDVTPAWSMEKENQSKAKPKTNPRQNQKPKTNKQTQVNQAQGMRKKRTWGCKSGGVRAAASESNRSTKTQREREDWRWRYWTLKEAKAEGRRRPLLLLQNAIRVRVRG